MTSIQDRDRTLTIPKAASSIELMPIDKPDGAAQTWLYSGIFWMTVTMLIGVIEAVKLFYPEFLQGVPALAIWVRPFTWYRD
jgi:cbb3-type cytochrome oxidase subunit 1